MKKKEKKKKKVAIIIAVVLVVIVAVVIILLRLNGGSHTAVDNNPEPDVSGNSSTLVAYFSWSGNDQKMARWIAEETGADLFRIVPEKAYGNDFDSTANRAQTELNNETRPALSAHIDPEIMAQYDVIYLGFPIWWYDLPTPVWTFLEEYDLSGKTVIPFATSSSSGMGQSGTLLAAMAGTGDWQEGQRFSSGVSSADVQSWVKGLGL